MNFLKFSQITNVVPVSGVQVIQSKPLQQQKIIVSTGASPGATTKATIVTASPTSNQMVVQKLINMSKGLSSPTATATIVSSANLGQGITAITSTGSLINPQIIQIHQASNQRPQQLSTTGKMQTVSTASLTPLQQQNLLQSIKQQQLRVQNQQATATPQQQTLIIKQQQVLQQIQKQLQAQQQAQIQVNSPTKAGTSLLGTQIQLSPSVSGGQVTSMIVTGSTITTTSTQPQPQQTITRTIKAGTSLIAQAAQPQIGGGSPITAVRTVSGNNPLMGKVLTNAAGQIISLESLLQKQVVTSGPTLRLAGAKPGQTTSLIQLAGAPGSQITQYAVVSQGRNLISMAQPRLVTTQAVATLINNTSTVNSNTLTTISSRPTGLTTLSATNTSAKQVVDSPKTPTRTIIPQQTQTVINQQQQSPIQQRIIQSSQLQPISAQALVNAKVLGVQNLQGITQTTGGMANRVKAGTSIRMVNASNLNIAHIGGKPVIIASKTPNIMHQQAQQQQTGTRQNVIWQTQGAAGTAGSNSFVIGGQTVKVQGNMLTTTGTPFDQSSGTATLQTGQSQQQQTVMFGNQIVKLSQMTGQSTTGMPVISAAGSSATTPTRTVVLGSTGQTIKVHSPSLTQVGGKVTQHAQVVLGGQSFKVRTLLHILFF